MKLAASKKPRMAALAATAVLLTLQSTAVGQRRQNFWERTYDPNAAEYRQVIEQATSSFQTRDQPTLDNALARAAALKPDAPEVRYLRALVDQRRGDPEGCRRELDDLIDDGEFGTLNPEVVYAALAVALTRLGDLASAIVAYERALALRTPAGDVPNPVDNRPVYLANMGELRMAQAKLDDAVGLYRRSLQLRPSYPQALFGLAMAAERSDQHKEARGYLLRGVLADPGLASIEAPTAFMVPAEDRDFLLGLVREELGQMDLALAHMSAFVRAGTERDHPFLGEGQRALGRIEKQGPPVIGEGPVPLHQATAAAADPLGRFVAFGDEHGRVMVTRLREQKVSWAPTLSGPKVVDLGFTDVGELVVATADGYLRRYVPTPRFRPQVVGPFPMPAGADIAALSPDGGHVMTTSGRRRLWSVADCRRPTVELAHMRVDSEIRRAELGPRQDGLGAISAFFLSSDGKVWVERNPSQPGTDAVRPPGSARFQAMAPTSDGRYLIIAGTPYLLVVRTADLKVVRLVDLNTTDPIQEVVVDSAGGAGYGPAVLVVTANRFRALRLGSVLEGAL